jgi:hypothetical protein
MIRRLIMLSMAAFLVGISSYAYAAVLCANPSGSVFLRPAACKGNETALDPVALGLQGPQGPAGPAGPTGPSHAYFQSLGSAAGSPFHTIATLTVPAGSYIIDARTVLFGGRLATCFLRYSTLPGPGFPSLPPGDGLQIVMPVPTVFETAEVLIALHDAQTLPGPGTTDITFNCTDEADQFDSSTVLRATLVGALN